MEFRVDRNLLDEMIEEIDRLTPEDAVRRLESHSGRSIGVMLQYPLFQINEGIYNNAAQAAARIDWNEVNWAESSVTFSDLDDDAANDDKYAIAA